MISRAAVAACIALALADPAFAADRVELRSGAVVEGTVESVTDTVVVLRVGSETRELPRSLIARVVRDAAPATAVPSAATPKAPLGTDGAATQVPSKGASSSAPTKPTTGEPAAAPGPNSAQTLVEPLSKSAGENAGGKAGETSATKPAASVTVPAEPAVADSGLAAALGSNDPAKVEAAAEAIIAGWPGTLPTLKIALASPSVDCRRESLFLVQRSVLKGVEPLVVKAVGDADPSVRLLAIRAMRGGSYAEHEGLLIAVFSTASELGVRHECLRTLEVIGSVKCLGPVLESFAKVEAPDTRRRHLRVLRTLTGKDAKDDIEAWREIVRNATLEAHLRK